MKRPRITIARLLLAILVIAFNAALIRAFFDDGSFSGIILLLFAMQVGLLFLLRSQGRGRLFWVGFEMAGFATIIALFRYDLTASALYFYVSSYQDFAFNTVIESPHIPPPVANFLMEYSQLLYAAVSFAPELVMALMGGLFAMLAGPGLRRRVEPESSRSSLSATLGRVNFEPLQSRLTGSK
jgi:hypothetical protein